MTDSVHIYNVRLVNYTKIFHIAYLLSLYPKILLCPKINFLIEISGEPWEKCYIPAWAHITKAT